MSNENKLTKTITMLMILLLILCPCLRGLIPYERTVEAKALQSAPPADEEVVVATAIDGSTSPISIDLKSNNQAGVSYASRPDPLQKLSVKIQEVGGSSFEAGVGFEASGVRMSPNFAYSPADKIGVAYPFFDSQANKLVLRYDGQLDPGVFTTQMIIDEDLAQGDRALEFGADGRPRVAYHALALNPQTGFLEMEARFARWDGNDWVKTVIHPGPLISHTSNLSIAVSPVSGETYVAFVAWDLFLSFMRFNLVKLSPGGAILSSQVIENGASDGDSIAGFISDMKVDSTGQLHMVYMNLELTNVVKYFDGAIEQVASFDSPIGGSSNVSIALDKDRVPYVAFNFLDPNNVSQALLRVVKRESPNNWTPLSDLTLSRQVTDVVIAIGTDNVLQAAYKDAAEGNIKLVKRSLDSALDSDGDGLPDDWEVNGYTYNGQFVDLPAMGAKPDHKDIFVEVDYMVGSDHSHEFNPAAMKLVKDAFAAVPNSLFAVPNPDGQDGITLHVRIDDALAHQDTLGTVTNNQYDWTAFDLIKATHFDEALALSHHYCVFAHDYSDDRSSGIARDIPSADFIVSLGSAPNQVGTIFNQAGTFMHELGHNLGLRHGGFESSPNHKPNYLSVMNYSFQHFGLRLNGANGFFDYSRFDLPALNEMSLDESIGLNGGAALIGYGASWFCGANQVWVNDANGVINWNCDNSIESSAFADINNDGQPNVLRSFNDWANLNFKGGSIGAGAVLPPPQKTVADEMDLETARSLKPAPPSGLAGRFNNCSIHLAWQPAGPPEEFTYRVYRSADGQPFTLLLSTPSPSIFDTSVRAATSYSYQVTVVNAFDAESIASDAITIKGASELIADLLALVRSFNLHNGIANSLSSKLNNARDAIDSDNKTAACSKVGAFINEVDSQSGKKLSLAQARQLKEFANNIKSVMCCGQ